MFVSLLVGLRKKKTAKPISTKFDRWVAHGPWNDPLDCGGNPDHVTLGLGLGLWKGYGYG